MGIMIGGVQGRLRHARKLHLSTDQRHAGLQAASFRGNIAIYGVVREALLA
jgi:hypothetical protein